MKRFAGFPLAGIFFIQACAFMPQKAALRPNLSFKESTLGQGAEVFLIVADERPDQVIGYRGGAGWNSGPITTENDVADVVEQKIREGLTQKGFKLVPSKTDQARSLRVEIRSLQYLTTMGFFTMGVVTKAALKAVAALNGIEYQQLYRHEKEQRVFFIPFAGENEYQINETLAEAIANLFRDQKLLGFLAKPGAMTAPAAIAPPSGALDAAPGSPASPSASAAAGAMASPKVLMTIPASEMRPFLKNLKKGAPLRVQLENGSTLEGAYSGSDELKIWIHTPGEGVFGEKGGSFKGIKSLDLLDRPSQIP